MDSLKEPAPTLALIPKVGVISSPAPISVFHSCSTGDIFSILSQRQPQAPSQIKKNFPPKAVRYPKGLNFMSPLTERMWFPYMSFCGIWGKISLLHRLKASRKFTGDIREIISSCSVPKFMWIPAETSELNGIAEISF